MNPFDIFVPPEQPKPTTITLPPIPVPKSLEAWYKQTMKTLERLRQDGQI